MNRPLVANAGDREQVKRAGEREKTDAEQNDDDIVSLMSTASGRRFVWRRLIQDAGIMSDRYAESGERMAFLNGRTNLALPILKDIDRLCPDQYDLMRREARANV